MIYQSKLIIIDNILETGGGQETVISKYLKYRINYPEPSFGWKYANYRELIKSYFMQIVRNPK